ncbi:hypothetical protein TNCT_135971 [Trichonephila clavata]|uniref:Uncharacterized protein n=1 Tax=Trichonephila clavata TaxID=2740835 RepID=A0A8X6LV27_TRICU|nr:hypothetical protein TNCT_135971 [Trichonephila clavata]
MSFQIVLFFKLLHLKCDQDKESSLAQRPFDMPTVWYSKRPLIISHIVLDLRSPNSPQRIFSNHSGYQNRYSRARNELATTWFINVTNDDGADLVSLKHSI